MPPPNYAALITAQAVLTEQVKALTDSVNALGCTVGENTKLLNEMRLANAQDHQMVISAHTRIDGLSKTVEGLDKKIDDMAQAVDRVVTPLKWLMGVTTALIVAILIAIATGKAMIVFP